MKISQRLKDLAISDNGFVFDPVTGYTFTVNQVGLFILNLLKEGLGVEDITAKVIENFDVTDPREVAMDVKDFLIQLKTEGILPSDAEEA